MGYFSNSSAARKAVEQGVASASDRLHLVYDNAKGAASPALQRVAGKAHTAADRIADRAHYAADAIAEKRQQLPSLQQIASSTRGTVKRHPLLTVGVAIAGGVLLSWWVSRRQKQQQGPVDQQ